MVPSSGSIIQLKPFSALSPVPSSAMKPASGALIFVLIAAVAVLGYLYMQEKDDNVTIELDPPKISVE